MGEEEGIVAAEEECECLDCLCCVCAFSGVIPYVPEIFSAFPTAGMLASFFIIAGFRPKKAAEMYNKRYSHFFRCPYGSGKTKSCSAVFIRDGLLAFIRQHRANRKKATRLALLK